MSLFQTFDKNAKKLKVAFLSILPFGTKLGGFRGKETLNSGNGPL